MREWSSASRSVIFISRPPTPKRLIAPRWRTSTNIQLSARMVLAGIHGGHTLHGEFELQKNCNAGSVAAALQTSKGNVYTGICAHLCCGIGTCAEHAAVLEMLKARETQIVAVVAVGNGHKVLSPCGRCRELLAQVDRRNLQCRVLMPDGNSEVLEKLLPNHWMAGVED